MGKKPEANKSNHPNGDADDDIDLESGLNGDDDGDDGDDDDDDDDDDEDDDVSGKGGSDAKGIEAQLEKFSDSLMSKVTSEIDRRINGALNKRNRSQKKDDDQNDDKQEAPVADVRSARLAFREAIGSEIKFLSSEERAFGTEYGRMLITAQSVKGFDDPDEVGEDAARQVALKLKDLRSFYSKRTKAVLEKQGALKEQRSGNGSSSGSGTQIFGKTKGSELATSIREELKNR